MLYVLTRRYNLKVYALGSRLFSPNARLAAA